MAAINGISGNVAFATGYVTNVHSWTLNTTAEWLPTTDFGDAWEKGTTGVKKFNGSFVCYADDTTTLPLPDAGAGVAQAFTFTAAAGRVYTGTGFITGIDISISEEGDSREVTMSFQGTGVLGAA